MKSHRSANDDTTIVLVMNRSLAEQHDPEILQTSVERTPGGRHLCQSSEDSVLLEAAAASQCHSSRVLR